MKSFCIFVCKNIIDISQASLALVITIISIAFLSGCASAVRYSSRNEAARENFKPATVMSHQTKDNKPKNSNTLSLFTNSDFPISSVQQNLLDTAMRFLGTSYCYGGNGPQCIDCSGFTSQVFGMCGFVLPRTAQLQSFIGREIPPKEAAIGDLVFFSFNNRTIEHVGIYAGNGSIIHASKSKGVVMQQIDGSGLLSGLFSIRRVIGSM